MSNNEYVSGKDFTSSGSNFTGKGEAVSEFRGLQADLNLFAQASNFEAVKIDGVVGARTADAVKKVVEAVLAKNKLLIPAAFTYNNSEDIARYAPRIRDWLQTTAASTLSVAPFRIYKKGSGQDWNVKGDIAYGAGPVHDEFVGLQNDLNKFADVAGFQKLTADGFIGPKTASAVKAVYDKVVARNAVFAVTLFPPPDTKEEAAEFAAFIRDWLDKTATRQLLAEAGA
jgi:lysozyme family protein